MRQLIAGLLLLGLAGNASAATCTFEAFFVDEDAKTNVRAAPSADAPVIATVDPAQSVATLREARGGWFRVDKVVDFETEKTLFRGNGWLHSSVIGLAVAGGDHRLYAAPSTRSATMQRLIPDGNMLDLLDCRGKWVKVRVDGSRVGWMAPAAQCSNPFTTCS